MVCKQRLLIPKQNKRWDVERWLKLQKLNNNKLRVHNEAKLK